jgi:hypothetical protein
MALFVGMIAAQARIAAAERARTFAERDCTPAAGRAASAA